jgi:hypothetical protein
MSGFVGGSAHAMAMHVAEGNVLMTPIALKKLSRPEIQALVVEIEKVARDVRGENPPLDDTVAVQKRNRRIARMNQALQVIRNYQTSKR